MSVRFPAQPIYFGINRSVPPFGLSATTGVSDDAAALREMTEVVRLAEVGLPAILRTYFQTEYPRKVVTDQQLKRSPGGRYGCCTDACYQVSGIAMQRGNPTFNTGNRSASRLTYLFEKLVGRSASNQAFRHDISVIGTQANDKRYLVDLTIGQFIGKEGQIGSRLIGDEDELDVPRYTGKNIKDYPVLQQLLRDGFVELTPENLIQYLQALTLDQSSYNQDYLIRGRVTQDQIEKVFRRW